MHRALDLRRVRRRTVKVLREEDPLQQRFHLIAAVAERPAELGARGVRDVFANEVAVELRGDELAGDRLPQDDVDDLLAVEGPALAEKRLLTEVVLRRDRT